MIEDKRLFELESIILKQKEEIKQYENLGKNEIREKYIIFLRKN